MPATQTQVKQMTAALSNIFTGRNKMSCSPGQRGGGWSRWVGWWSHISSRTRHRNWPCLGIWTEGNIILDLTHLHCHYCFLSISLYSPLLKLKASREYTEPSVSCLLFLLRQLEGRGVTVMRLNIRWGWCSPAFQHQPRQGILNASTYCSSGSFSKRLAMNIYRCTSNCTSTSKIWKIWVYFQGEYIIFYFQEEKHYNHAEEYSQYPGEKFKGQY